MTKEQVQDRITKLETERDQLKTTLIAYEGAIQDCKYWLQQEETPAVTSPETKEINDGQDSSNQSC